MNNNRTPTVSVCVPTYNQESVLRQALDGILLQQDCDYEIIIANDSSTDNTDKICREYLDKYPEKIRYIQQPRNKGIIKNTEDCLKAATGKYIAICEGDDYWITSDKLAKQAAVLDADSHVSMVHTWWRDYIQDKNRFRDIPEQTGLYISNNYHGSEAVREIMFENYRGIRFSSIMFRRKLLELIESDIPDFFNPEFTTLDIGFFYVAAFYGKIAYLSDISTIYRVQSESVSITSDQRKRASFSIGILTAKLYFARKFNLQKKDEQLIMRNSMRSLGPYIVRSRDIDLTNRIINLKKHYSLKYRIGQYLCIKGAQNIIIGKILSVFIP